MAAAGRLRRRASRSAPRRTPTTSSARTGASRRGGRTGSPSSATSRSATSSAPCSGTPAASGSTTSSGCSGCGGSRPGARPNEGTYVRYDHAALIGVLALEAHRAGAVVVGEDLGVVAPEARDFLRARGILGTSILWFEYGADGGPLPAEHWREWCLASVTTHDLPPTAGYLAGDQVRLQHQLGLLEGDLDDELRPRRASVDGWLAEVRRRGLLPEDADADDVVEALHRYLALTPARLLCVALTDAVGDRRTQNQPGTTDEYPNWRVPLAGPDGVPMSLEEVFASHRARALAASVAPSPPRPA